MARKEKVDLEERKPWNGENHKGEGYNEPTVTTSMMGISPELLKGNIKAVEKEVKQNKEARSDELEEGMKIEVELGGYERGTSKGE